MSYIGRIPTNAALTASDLADGIVSADKIASNAVTTAKINGDAVTDAKIADDVVGTEHLTANEVDTTALGADAVTGAQLADDAVNSEHYTDGSIDTAHIADVNVTQGKIADQAINEAKMQISNAPTNGYMLTAQSGNTGGLTWAEAGGGSMNLISTTTVSSGTSTVDITGMDSTYKNYKIIITNLHCATNNVSLNGRAIIGGSAQTGTNYAYINHHVYHDGTPGHVLNSSSDATSWKIIHSGAGNENDESLHSEFIIGNPSETTFKKFMHGSSGWTHYDSGKAAHNIGTYVYASGTAALTGIQFLMSSGNIDSAIIKLYGIS